MVKTSAKTTNKYVSFSTEYTDKIQGCPLGVCPWNNQKRYHEYFDGKGLHNVERKKKSVLYINVRRTTL